METTRPQPHTQEDSLATVVDLTLWRSRKQDSPRSAPVLAPGTDPLLGRLQSVRESIEKIGRLMREMRALQPPASRPRP